MNRDVSTQLNLKQTEQEPTGVRSETDRQTEAQHRADSAEGEGSIEAGRRRRSWLRNLASSVTSVLFPSLELEDVKQASKQASIDVRRRVDEWQAAG